MMPICTQCADTLTNPDAQMPSFAVQINKSQGTEAQPAKPDAPVTGLPNGIMKHEPAADAMELDGPQAPGDSGLEKKAPPKWRWRLLSFTLLPGVESAALVILAVRQLVGNKLPEPYNGSSN